MMRPLHLLCVQPGASYATADVYVGYIAALRRLGHTIREYKLDQRIDDAGDYYTKLYRRKKAGKVPPELILTKACADVIPQALYHDVDGVVIFSGMYFSPDTLVMLRRAGIPTALVLSESPYDDEQQARVVPWADVVFTNERTSVPVLREHNPNTHYLPHAHDPARHRAGSQPGDELVLAHDVVFVGSLFEERINLLGGVDWTGIDFGLYGSHNILPSRHRLRKHIRGGIVDNATAAALYRRAKIGLNLYRTSQGFGIGVGHIQHAESLSPRAVELAACGVFHLSEKRAEVWETFGLNVPTFRDSEGLWEHIQRFLTWPEMRARFARELPAKVEHLTFDRLAPQMVSTLRAAWCRGERSSERVGAERTMVS